MMSYLWILLLGSLLATSAKAQEPTTLEAVDATPVPEDEDAKPTAAADDPEPVPGDEDTEPTAAADDTEPVSEDEDAEPTAAADDTEPVSEDEDAEPTAAADDTEPVSEDEDAEPTAAVDDTEPVPVNEDAEPTAAVDATEPVPVDEDAEPTTAGDNAGLATPADEDIQPTTPVVDTEAELDSTTEEPAADSEDGDSIEAVETEPSATIEKAPTQDKSKPDDQPTPEPYPEVKDVGDDLIDQVDEDKISQDVGIKINSAADDLGDNVLADGEFDLGDALSEPNLNSGKSRSFDPGAQSAVAQGNADKPQTQKASSGTLAGILCAIGVAAVGAVTGYFTYQRKQLCFKNRQEADPEAARKADTAEAQADPQVLSNLLDKQ